VWGDLPLTEPPSFYWYRNNAASFIIDHTGVELRNRVGIDNMMWSSDYPHHGNDWPYSRRTIEEMMGGVAEEERTRIAGGNAERIWSLEL
jgi:predicted TIM-barrel fold metal-dependent hydrolase